jgi:membrane protein implicated in regulation of membrane protease activity
VDAAAHACLLGVLASAVGVVPALLLLLKIGPVGLWNLWLSYVASYVLLLVAFIVLQAFRAYEDSTDQEARESDRKLRG